MSMRLGADELEVRYGAGLERAFPELFFVWFAVGETVCIEIHSWCGTASQVRVSYPHDLCHVYDTARQHVDADAARDLVADRLVAAVTGGYDQPGAAHAPYILRWLAVPQRADVSFSDHPEPNPDLHTDLHLDVRPDVYLEVSQVMRSTSVALVHTSSRRLKVWAGGTGVLHCDETPSGNEPSRKATSLDLASITLRDFQALWLPADRRSVVAEVATVQHDLPASSPEAAALRLLADYDSGIWLHHHRFVDAVNQPTSDGRIDWARINRLSTMHTEATVQDRAVLAIACHLSDEVTPTISLPDALHLVGDARTTVLEALDGLTGRHPDPHTGWPTDCTACP